MARNPEVDALQRQVKALRRQMVLFDHWHNTAHSPLYKRLWWWVQGFRLCSLGTWYRAPWNRSALKYEERRDGD